MKKIVFLVNASGRRSVHTTARRSPNRAPKKVRAKMKARGVASEGHMAKKRKGGKRGAHKARRRGGFLRRFGMNPPASEGSGAVGIRQAPRFLVGTVVNAAEVLAGILAARKVRSLAGFQPQTPVGSAVEILVGLGGGMLLSRVNRNAGARFAEGAVLSVLLPYVANAGIPGVSATLGDDGLELGDVVQVLPAGDRQSRYLSGGDGSSQNMSDFVSDFVQ